jgi:hypothetical protein
MQVIAEKLGWQWLTPVLHGRINHEDIAVNIVTIIISDCYSELRAINP